MDPNLNYLFMLILFLLLLFVMTFGIIIRCRPEWISFVSMRKKENIVQTWTKFKRIWYSHLNVLGICHHNI